ncbi:MAG: type II secretion system F family protein [Chloroflexi bacterium]|nr:type II secretion system F family protein [Chloroflexota bacterium]
MVAIGLSVVVFLVVTLVVVSALSVSRTRRVLLHQMVEAYAPESASGPSFVNLNVLRTQRPGLVRPLERLIEETSLAGKISLEMLRADLPLRAGEYVALHVAVAVVLLAILLYTWGNLLIAAAAVPASYLAIRIFVKRRQNKIARAFEGQLPEAIDMINSSLKSGFGLLQGLETVERDMPRPIKDEFAQLVRDISVGMPLDDALNATCMRMPSHDLYLFVTAVLVHRSVGGNLSEVLVGIANTIRARLRARDEVHTLTTTARVSSYVVTALPFILFVVISIVNPGYLSPLLTRDIGRLMLAVAGATMLIGLYLSNRFTKIEY